MISNPNFNFTLDAATGIFLLNQESRGLPAAAPQSDVQNVNWCHAGN